MRPCTIHPFCTRSPADELSNDRYCRQQAPVGSGLATLVTYDYDKLVSTAIPQDMRDSLTLRLPPTAKL